MFDLILQKTMQGIVRQDWSPCTSEGNNSNLYFQLSKGHLKGCSNSGVLIVIKRILFSLEVLHKGRLFAWAFALYLVFCFRCHAPRLAESKQDQRHKPESLRPLEFLRNLHSACVEKLRVEKLHVDDAWNQGVPIKELSLWYRWIPLYPNIQNRIIVLCPKFSQNHACLIWNSPNSKDF